MIIFVTVPAENAPHHLCSKFYTDQCRWVIIVTPISFAVTYAETLLVQFVIDLLYNKL